MLDWLLDAIETLAIRALNALIAGLGAVLQALVSLLPDMPELPEPPDALIMAESWVAWVFPVGALLTILAFVLAMYLLWQAVAIALRWAKATDG